MLNIFKTTPDGLKRLQRIEPGSWIDLVSPTDEEVAQVADAVGIPVDLLRQPLDAEEKSRIDTEDGLVLIIVNIPVIERTEEEQGYDTIPLGMLVHPDYLITACLKPNPILGEFERGVVKGFVTAKKTRFVLQILLTVSSFYLRYLGRINRETDRLESKLRASQQNQELFDLLTLEKALVYFTTSLRSNEAVLQKLMRSQALEMYEEDQELLEDVIVENRQAIEMATIYSHILSGMMDAFASVISNNLNRVMKFLTSVTIMIAVPTLVASLYGMNVKLPLAEAGHAFTLVLSICAAISALGALVFWRKHYF